MWIEKTSSGKYKYCERYKDPKTGKLKKLSVVLDGKTRTDRKAAQDALQSRIRDACLGTGISPSLSFAALCVEYTKAQRHTVKAQTAEANERKNKTLRRLIGDDVLVNQLTAPYVRRALEADNPTTYNERLKRFKALMRWAYREEYVENINYLDKLQRLKAPPVREKNAEKYLEKDELAALIEGMKAPTWRLLTRFLALSGLRIGEAIALTDDDVDLLAREISVNKTYSLDLQIISSTKTETSTRAVYMQDELFSCCMLIKDRKKELRRLFGYDADLFFPGDDGDFIRYPAYNKYLKENTERIVGRPLTVHALRHTHVAMLAEEGIPLEVIARRLGHSSSRITREIYMHVTDKMVEREHELLRKVHII